jgi:hypothetical protein
MILQRSGRPSKVGLAAHFLVPDLIDFPDARPTPSLRPALAPESLLLYIALAHAFDE